MCALKTIDDTNTERALGDSISRRSRGLLTSKSSKGWRTYKFEFFSGSRDSGQLGISIFDSTNECGFAPPDVGDAVGVTFRRGHKKCMFSTTVLPAIPQGPRKLLSLAWPEHLQNLQRRAYQRAAPPRGVVVPVRFWREDVADLEPSGSKVRTGQLQDLSAGGLRVKVSGFTDIEIGATYRCVFAPGPRAPTLLMDVILQHHEDISLERSSLGFQIVGLETTPEGRRTLDQLAETVSRFKRTVPRNRTAVPHSGGAGGR